MCLTMYRKLHLELFPLFENVIAVCFWLSAIAFNQMSNANLEGLACVKCVNHIRR